MFDRSTFEFLDSLAKGKDKPWFEAHRETYEGHLLGPMRRLVENIGPRLLAIDADFETTPAVNKTLTRVNRDMRFARGQSPYKGYMMALFYRRGRKKLDPQLFVGVQPTECWIGLYVGPELLNEAAPIRSVIRNKPAKLRAAAAKADIGMAGGNMLCTCERYGEVKTVLSGDDLSEYASGPHLVVMRRLQSTKVVAAGDGFGATCADWLSALHPLWGLYAQ